MGETKQKLLRYLQRISEFPLEAEITPSEEKLVKQLETFAAEIRAYSGGLFICGPHASGKSIAVKYFLAKQGCFPDAYVDVSRLVSKKTIPMGYEIHEILNKAIDAQPKDSLIIFDECDILRFLEEDRFRSLIAKICWLREKKIVMVLPDELGRFPREMYPDRVFRIEPTDEDLEALMKIGRWIDLTKLTRKSLIDIIKEMMKD